MNNLLNSVSNAKTYKQLTEVLKPLFLSGEIEVYQTLYCKFCVLLHGDNLINIRTDLINYHANTFEYTIREPNLNGSYDLIRNIDKEKPLKNNGAKVFYDMLNKLVLNMSIE